MRPVLLLFIVSAAQICSLSQGYNVDQSASHEAEDRLDDRVFPNRPRAPLRRLREKVSGLVNGGARRPVPIASGGYPSNPPPVGFVSSGGLNSGSPCVRQAQSGCDGPPAIPVATGGLHPPPGYVDDQDVFTIDNFPSLIPANGFVNPVIGMFGRPQTPSGFGPSIGSSQNTPSFSPAYPPPPPSSSVSHGTSFQVNTPVAPSVNRFDSIQPQNTQGSGVYEKAALDVVNGIKDFTLDLLSTFRAIGSTKNVVFSPVSIASLLSLLNLGTRGLSKQEIEIALNLPESQAGVNAHEIYKQILQGVNYQSAGVNITTGARLFFDQNIRVKQPFIDNAHNYYNCSVSLENFRSRPGQTRRRINKWVEDQTYGKITNFISASLPSTTRMVIANTIYFSGSWSTPFPEFVTTERDFNTGRKKIKIPMMTNVLEAPHYSSSVLNVDAVALPYTGGKYAMIVILPKEAPSERSIIKLEQSLDAFYIEELLRNMTMKQVSVSIPKMKLSMKVQLKDNLEQLRVSSIFNTFLSDFSDLSDDKPLFVNQMLHEAVMEITEKGTIAAAASGVMLDRIGGFPRVVVDKPAIFYIADYVNALPLFWARVVEPVRI